jgi:steroid delta-isomerase-like uncharacterized protein
MPTARSARESRLRDAWAASWDRGEVAALDELLAPDYVRRSHASGNAQNREELKASILAVRGAFPDLKTTIDEIVAENDGMAIRWHSAGTHTGSFLGVPPTGRPVEVFGVTFTHFTGDTVAEEWVTWDPRQLLAALGIIALGDAD